MNLIIGRAGTGKTEEILERIREDIKNEKRIYLIVPEQFTYTFEKKLTDSFSSIFNVQILSFSRLVEQILRDSKNKNKIYLDDISRTILLETILEKLDLKVLSNKEKNIEAISNIIEEIKKYDVKLEDLKEFIDLKKEKNGQSLFLIKLEEIYNIYLKYNEEIENKYLDIADKEYEALKIIDESSYFQGSHIYIDQFAKFTYGEYNLIEKMLKQAESVNIAITTDNIRKKSDFEVFSTTKNTISDLIQISQEIQENNKKINIIEKKVNIKHEPEIKNLELAMFKEGQILSRKNDDKNEENSEDEEIKEIEENITLRVYKNIEDELDDVAQDILNKVINKGYSFKDIAIVFNDINSQEDLVRRVFSKYNIPIYLELDKRLEKNSIARYILELLEIISSNFSIESVFAFLKLGYYDFGSNFNFNDIYLLEKYVLRWNIRGSKWKNEWKNYDKLPDEDFDRLLSFKDNFVKFVENFKETIGRYKSSKDISNAIYELIEKEEIFRKSINDIENFNISDERKLELKQEYATSLNLLKDSLDRIVSIKGDQNISYEKYCNIFKLVLKETHIKQIPSIDDAVHFITTKTLNMDGIKSLYIVSLDDSLYPMLPTYKGLITDDEKLVLRENNIDLSETDIEKLSDDDFNMYSIFMIPSTSLHLSYHISSLEGDSKRPSIYINKIKRRLKYLEEENRIKGLYKEEISVYTNKALLDKVLSKYLSFLEGKNIEDEWKYLIYVLQNTSEEFKSIEKNILDKNIAPNLSQDILEKLYKNDIYTSVSKLEQYASCPFSYFARYTLNLQEDEKYELNPLNTGILLHDVIEEVVNRVKCGEISLNEINKKLGFLNESKTFELREGNAEYNQDFENIMKNIDNITDTIINEKLKEDKYKMFMFSPKFESLTEKFKIQIKDATKAIINSLRLSDFDVLGNEIYIGGDDFKSSSFDLKNNRRVKLSGIIDRADVFKKDNKTYLRIVDYKSSAKYLDENLIDAGLHLQLLTYLSILSKEKNYVPAGALYFGLSKYIKSISTKSEKDIAKASYNNNKMTGIVLADTNIVKAMDKSLDTGYSSIIPVQIKQDGDFGAHSKVKTEDEFEVLRKTINKNIINMSENIFQGNISINPYKYRNQTGCKYCPYKKICQFDIRKNRYRNIKSKKKEKE